ncbi:MAG: hypothetical protein BroJett040_12490 [Oligoflexia bacterium]|nr:MAG: hypothetical protein BroJett040_12490 [Oligoflexia bacterium]
MSVWFYNEKGQSKGPVSAQAIVSLWRQGLLKGEDLAYLQEKGEWKTLLEWDELRALKEMNQDLHRDISISSEIWILLQKDSQGRFLQNGPYDSQQILDLIKKAQVQQTDYLWKKGFEQWVQIKDLPEFSVVEPKLTEEQNKMLTAIEEMPKLPAEDFSSVKAPVISLRTMVGITGLIVLLGGLVMVTQTQKESQSHQMVEAEKAVVETDTTTVNSQVKVGPTREIASVSSAPKKQESKLNIQINQNELMIKTSELVGSVVRVIIHGRSGEILEIPALNIKTSSQVNSKGEIRLDLGGMRVPAGYYEIRVENMRGGLLGSERRFLGKDVQMFESKIEKHKKQISFLQQQERKKLLKNLNDIEGKISKAVGARGALKVHNFDKWWAKNVGTHLPKEIEKSQSNRSELVYVDQWKKVGHQIEKLKLSLKSDASSGRKPASSSLDQFKRQMRKLHKEASQYSVSSQNSK